MSTPLGSTLRRLLDHLAAIDANHHLRAQLRRLDDRTLRDVGLGRADIDAEIRRLACHGRRGEFDPPEALDDAARDVSRRPMSGETESRPPDIVT
jgi:uncharacterized protein YjiS (DUF1127 family)